MLIEIFVTFLVTAERVIFNKVYTNDLLEVGGGMKSKSSYTFGECAL